jgi:hypothetical protein
VGPRHALAAVALASAVALAAFAQEDAAREGEPTALPGSLLGVTDDGGASRLARVAPVTLRPLPGRRPHLKGPLEAWALSPGGSRLAAVTDRASVLRLIDVERMHTLGRLRTRARGSPAAVVWPRPHRLWIVLARPGCCARGATTVVTVDPIARRVLARRRLAGGLARVASTPDGPVLLLAPRDLIGPATLATVDAAGAVEQLPLDGVSAGVIAPGDTPSVEHVRTPALAVDANRRRAYVLPARPQAVEIDLRRRRVRHHRLVPRPSLVERVRELLVPSAAASAQVGWVRSAAWVGEAHIALSGHDAAVVRRPDGGVEAERRPAGLRVIDTRDWSVRTLDDQASAFVTAAGLLLTSGPRGRGLAGYSPDERGGFHVLADHSVEVVATASSLAYVRTPPRQALRVVDLARGRLIGTSARGRARLLMERVPAGWR